MQNCIRRSATPVQVKGCGEKIETAGATFTQLSGLLLAGNEVRLKILYLLEAEKKLETNATPKERDCCVFCSHR